MSEADLSRKQSAFLLEFKYGDPASPTYTRYTDWTRNIISGGITYTAQTAISITIPENTGMLMESPLKLELPSNSFVDRLTNGEPHSLIQLTLTEIRGLDKITQETEVKFIGDVDEAISNYQGRNGIVYIEVAGEKSQYDKILGIQNNRHCIWNVFGPGCGLLRSDFTESVTISAISGKQLTITGASTPDASYWRFGFISKDGIDLQIRDWDSAAPTIFELEVEPPADWASASVVLTPGCDKLETTCDTRYGNQGNWTGIGVESPDHNPMIES